MVQVSLGAIHKIEEACFHGFPRIREPPSWSIHIRTTRRVGIIQMAPVMEYLALTLNSRWGIGAHFHRLVLHIGERKKAIDTMHRMLSMRGICDQCGGYANNSLICCAC